MYADEDTQAISSVDIRPLRFYYTLRLTFEEDMMMTVIRWDPFRDLNTLQDRMNRLFEDANRGSKSEDASSTTAWSPAVDIHETDVEIVVKAELPEPLYRPAYRLTVDEAEDLKLMEAIFDRLYRPGEVLDTAEAIRLLDKEPRLAAINAHLRHGASNLRSVELDKTQ